MMKYAPIPAMAPKAMLFVRGCTRMHRKAGIASDMSRQLISTIESLKMRTPMMTRIGPSAIFGMGPAKMGDKKHIRKNKREHTTAHKPVRPPSLTAEADSTYVVKHELPKRPPHIVPIASAENALLELGMIPVVSSMIPIMVPME